MRILCCGTLVILLGACMAPPLELQRIDGDKVVVRLETLGEYPSPIRRIKLSDTSSGSVIWEIQARTTIPQIWQVSLRAGVNPTILRGYDYQVLHPKRSRSFHLDPGKDYKIRVWGRRGLPAEAAFKLTQSPTR